MVLLPYSRFLRYFNLSFMVTLQSPSIIRLIHKRSTGLFIWSDSIKFFDDGEAMSRSKIKIPPHPAVRSSHFADFSLLKRPCEEVADVGLSRPNGYGSNRTSDGPFRAGRNGIGVQASRDILLHPQPPSNREREVLSLVAEGFSNKLIATHLIISERTVKNHLTNVMTKLRAFDRTHAVVTAVRLGWLAI